MSEQKSKKSAKKQELTVEDIYKEKTHHEHILSAPDTYIGSAECDMKEMWVFDRVKGKIVLKDITFPPGLYKTNDELLVNARDHKVRDPTCKIIKVNIDQKNNCVTVYNDGNGIPIEMHKIAQVYVPEMIFGRLLTSQNYDQKGKIVGGKNGYGAKLANIYSTTFIVETVDKKTKKKYTQKFENNMYTVNPAKIEDVPAKTSPYTKITFYPDLKRFGIDRLTDDIVSLLEKRVYDLAVGTGDGTSVYLNDKQIKVTTFQDYMKLYYDKLPSELIYQEFSERWRVGVLFDPTCGFRQISFVNGVSTYQGGTHVTHVLDQITREVISHIKEKNKDINIKASYIRDNLTLFIDCVIEDPTFSSQTKEHMTTKISDFGSKCEMTSDFVKKILKTGIADEVVRLAEFKHQGELTKSDAKKTDNVKTIDKLDDAHWAGKANKSKYCRLILTEGDSAKNFAVAGLDIVGRDRFGVFPLRGKFLNVREATVHQLLANEEFINLKKILGLKQGRKYNDVNKLRYGGIIILTDQDVDGSHIKGLIVNMLAYFWPSLLKLDGYIQCMSTPIVKAFKKSDSKKQNALCFYTLTAYKNWIDKEDTSKYVIKYYKGLGTSTEKEAKEIFNEFENRLVKFVWETAEGGAIDKNNPLKEADNISEIENNDDVIETIDEESSMGIDDDDNDDEEIEDIHSKSHDAITLAFEKSRANDRKNWLFHYDKNNILDIDNKSVPFSHFINKELIHFSAYSNQRSIPSVIDGFKPSHRKILYGCFKRKIENEEVKVAQLGAYVAEHTLYHHGETSLYGTIVNMAQTFVGSNNINLLLPYGNFGSRRVGGKDAASPRYIYTQLNKLAPLIFRKEDDCIYIYVDEDGTLAEPERFAPILPQVLINGAEGIGTGFSTYVPPYNPKDLVENLRLLINDDDPKEMVPWVRGFSGQITVQKDGKVLTTGTYVVIDDVTLKITELPIGMWTDSYKLFLDGVSLNSKSTLKNKFVESYVNNSGNNRIEFKITFVGNTLREMIKANTVEKNLKLTTSLSLNNMYLHNSKGTITKYVTAEDILIEFYKYRLNVYTKRKQHVIKILENELKILESKVRFIEYILSRKIVIERRDEDQIIEDLHKNKFEELSYNVNSETPSYRYLTDMKLFSLSNNKMKELIKERDKKKEEYDIYCKLTIQELWLRELDEFTKEYDKWLVAMEEEESNTSRSQKNKGKQKNVKVKGKPVQKTLASS